MRKNNIIHSNSLLGSRGVVRPSIRDSQSPDSGSNPDGSIIADFYNEKFPYRSIQNIFLNKNIDYFIISFNGTAYA